MVHDRHDEHVQSAWNRSSIALVIPSYEQMILRPFFLKTRKRNRLLSFFLFEEKCAGDSVVNDIKGSLKKKMKLIANLFLFEENL